MKKGCEKTSQVETASDEPEKSKASKAENYAVGSKLEAKASGNWYAARVENINWETEEVYIHFDGWSTKHNEWIPMKSERLQGVQKPPPKKPPEKFHIGEKVIAHWSAYHKSQATVQKQLSDGKYEVLFLDGYVKRVQPGRMWRIDESDPSYKSEIPDIGSKQDRRNRKRKHVVADLFRSNKRPKTSSPLSDAVEKKSAPPPAALKKEDLFPTPSAPASVSVGVSPVTSKVKQPLEEPQPFEVIYMDGHKETWSKFTTRRTEGKTAGKIEIVIASSNGRKFRSKSEIVRFCDENKINYEQKLFDFSAKGRPKPKAKPKPENESMEKVAIPSETVTAAVEAPLLVAAPVDTEVQVEKRFIGEFEVVVQDGQFICPVSACSKHFRKENLLYMHTKHYHPDLVKYLNYAPSVTELAYARTVSILEQDSTLGLKSSARPDLRSADVKRSPSRTVDVKPETKLDTEQTATEASESTSTGTVAPTAANDSTQLPATPSAEGEGNLDTPAAEQATSSLLIRPSKPHWKRRPYHRGQHATSDWYGRVGKQPKVRTNVEPTGKQDTEPVGTIVQRNPILNTLLSSRPLAPVMPWRSNWRRKRRRGWRRRLVPVPPPSKKEPVNGSDESKFLQVADGIDGTIAADDIKYDKLKGNEIINCSCLIKEEDGLMIQCDVCLCWQHGHCQGINPATDVPESYICSICKDPPRGRSSRKYYSHQDWMKQGILPTLPFQSKQPSQKRLLLKRAFEVSGQLSLISRLLHSLRVKLSVASNKDHPKLWLWAKKWQENATPVTAQPDIKEEQPSTPKAPEPEKPIDPIECKLNLLDHILHYQDLVQNRLNSLDVVVAELEGMEEAAEGEEPENISRISATFKMLLRDLETVKKLSALP